MNKIYNKIKFKTINIDQDDKIEMSPTIIKLQNQCMSKH